MTEKKGIVKIILEWLSSRGIDLRKILNIVGFAGFLYGEIDSRLSLKDGIQKVLGKNVPDRVGRNYAFCFGGITLFLFLIQVVTGIFLTLYYRPTPADAYHSIQHIMFEVKFGWLIRSIHRWGAELMILTVFIHMIRVYFMAAYKNPREMNWLAGATLLCCTLTFGFTGYLLPWDQKAFWATTVGTNIPQALPIVGKYFLLILRGGETVGGETLTRFYSIHVILLPWVILPMLAFHFFMVRRQGISGPL